MKQTMRPQFLMLTILLVFPISSAGQHIYNKERDEQAQKALPLAEALKTGSLFETQLRNLASLAKRDFDTEFLVTKFQINAFSLDLLTWEKANTYICLNRTLRAQPDAIPSSEAIQASIGELTQAIVSAKKSLEAFKASVKKNEEKPDSEEENGDNQSILASLIERLGDLESVQKFAEGLGKADIKLITPKTMQALNELKEITGTLKTVYDAYTAKVEGFNELQGQLADLRIVLKKVAIESLQADEQHWKNVTAIRARREVDRADILHLVNDYMGIMRRLRLVDFTAGDPGSFCTAANNAAGLADGIDIRPRQMIAEHIKELVRRSGTIEQDNQEIMREARLALSRMKRPLPPSEFEKLVTPTLTALEDGLDHINPDDVIHQYELDIRDGEQDKKLDPLKMGLSDDLSMLRSAARDTSAGNLEAALRLIIIHRQRDLVRIRDMVADVPRALYTLAALIARGDTPDKLAELRFAQELHAYSIRKSAVRARAYELTVSTGAQRLALFHKGGIKPTDVAELVFAASNVALTPAILAR